MKTVQIFGLFLIIACSVSGLMGCEESPIEPQVGSGTLLKATIDGTPYTFDILTNISEYDQVLLFGKFGGSTNTPPVQSVTVSFNSDLDQGSFPRTLTGGDVTISVVTSDIGGGTPNSYQCPVLTGDCKIVLTASNGTIVDGTFSGTLENTQDENDKITVTNGEFSVKLTRN